MHFTSELHLSQDRHSINMDDQKKATKAHSASTSEKMGKLLNRVSPCTIARKRLYSVAGERDIIHKIPEREFLLHGQFLLDWKSDLPIMANVLSLTMSVDKEH
jgi:hypothetical protein